MSTNEKHSELIAMVGLIVFVLLLLAIVELPHRKADQQGSHVQADSPLGRSQPTDLKDAQKWNAAHLLGLSPDALQPPPPAVAAPTLTASVITWHYVAPLEYQRNEGTTCAEEGVDQAGNVVAARDWFPRRDGICHEDDAK